MSLPVRYVRRYVWAHNALFGRVRMALDFAREVQTSYTTTGEAKMIAAKIEADLQRLQQALKTRDDSLAERLSGKEALS